MSLSYIQLLLGFAFMVIMSSTYLMVSDDMRMAKYTGSPETVVREVEPKNENPSEEIKVVTPEYLGVSETAVDQRTVATVGNTTTESLSIVVGGSPLEHIEEYRSLLLAQGYAITNETKTETLVALYGKKTGGDMAVSIQSGNVAGTSHISIATLTYN